MDVMRIVQYVIMGNNMTKKFIVQWNRDDYGYIEIEAKSEQDARDKFDSGQFDDADLCTKGGSIEIERIELSK